MLENTGLDREFLASVTSIARLLERQTDLDELRYLDRLVNANVPVVRFAAQDRVRRIQKKLFPDIYK